MSFLFDWFARHAELLGLLTLLSITALLATILLSPLIVARIPADYFSTRKRQPSKLRRNRPVVYWGIGILKNLVGIVLSAMGVVMLITPGPGVVFLVTGLILVNYPGKYRLERWLVTRPRVLSSLNWMRTKAGKPPLQL